MIGLGIGALAQHANEVPASDRGAVADAIQSLGGNAIIGDPGVVGSVGAVAWVVAAIAAAVAYRRLGAPTAAWVPLGLSAIIVSPRRPSCPSDSSASPERSPVLAYAERASATQPVRRAPAAGTA